SNHRPTPPSADFTQGRVTAVGGLFRRSGPGTDYPIIGITPQGAIVDIFCKFPGTVVDGNPLWYQLADGTWAWSSARYIENLGPAPRWC
ncbi:SH3 domain-containing protein, partial [Streptomyces phyllanthi]